MTYAWIYPKNTFICKQMNLYLQQKKEKHVIKNVSDLKQQHKCLLQDNVIESNKKKVYKVLLLKYLCFIVVCN